MTDERTVMFETLTLLQADMEFEIRPGQHTIVKHINSSAQILTDEQDLWAVEGEPQVTAAALRENMDAHFEGREELQLMEYDIQKYLNRLYKHIK
eukprot:gene30729-38487_t